MNCEFCVCICCSCYPQGFLSHIGPERMSWSWVCLWPHSSPWQGLTGGLTHGTSSLWWNVCKHNHLAWREIPFSSRNGWPCRMFCLHRILHTLLPPQFQHSPRPIHMWGTQSSTIFGHMRHELYSGTDRCMPQDLPWWNPGRTSCSTRCSCLSSYSISCSSSHGAHQQASHKCCTGKKQAFACNMASSIWRYSCQLLLSGLEWSATHAKQIWP